MSTSPKTLNQSTQTKQQSQPDKHPRSSKRFVKHNKKRIIRWGILTANIFVLVIVLTFVVKAAPTTDQSALNANSSGTSTNSAATEPVDQLSSADIAAHVASLTGLAETTAVQNQADTVNIQLTGNTSNDAIVSKPQIVNTNLKSRRDIITYTTQPGDTVTSLAAKFNVTSDTIVWSNGLSGDSIPSGTVIHVLPGLNGIIYLVKPSDTPQALASQFQASVDQIIAFNDAEQGLPVGQYVIVPNGTPIVGVATGGSADGSDVTVASVGDNGYDPGFCTWYVASKIAVPGDWGNASSWAAAAALTGWTVSPIPVAGAIAQKGGGEGHVAIVEAVSADGTMIKYSDMNGLAGFNRVGYSGWVSASTFQNYIYH